MRGKRIGTIIASAIALLVPAAFTPIDAQASWTPGTTDWPTFRHSPEHQGEADGTSAFTAGQGGFARVKWQQDITYPVLGPVTVADIDDDATPEVIVNSSDVAVQITPPAVPDFDFSHKVESRNGASGAREWQQDEGDSFIFAIPADNAEIDDDDRAEVVYFRGNPLLNANDEEIVARSHTGAQQWEYQDADWNDVGEQVVGILGGVHTADVDGEATNPEIVFGANEALLNVSLGTQEPGCPNAGAPSADVQAQSISYFVHALNGEGAAASEQWQFSRTDALLVSTPVITDLNGDGKSDVVFGSGAPAGNLLGECEVHVSVDQTAVDDKIVAIDGADPPNLLWETEVNDPDGSDRPPAATPVVAGTTAGGDKILAFLIPVPKTLPPSEDPDRNVLIAFNGRTGAELWRLDLKPATIAPLSAADLDGDGQPEIIAQVGDRLAAFDNGTGANHWAGQGDDPLRGVPYDRTLTAAGVSVADLDSDGVLEIATILEGDPEDGDPASELLVVSGTDGAEEWRQTITTDSATGGPVIADVDGDDDLLEIVVGTGFFTVTDEVDHTGKVFVFEPNAPDLTVDDVEVIGSGIVNEAQTVRASVRNAGTRDASGAVFRLHIGGTPVGGDQGVDLAAGDAATVDFEWTPTNSGSHSLDATGDPDGAVRELNEENNARSETFRVKERPVAGFTHSPASPDETETVQFTDTSTDERTVVAWEWSCTDGFSSAEQNPSHTFADGGSYDCTLEVTDDDGLTDDVTQTITVAHVDPVAGFSFTETTPHVVSFTDTSTHPNGPDAPPTGWAYAWDFDNDGTTDSTQRSPAHDFGANPSATTVTLSVTDNDGRSDDISRSLQWPVADYSFSPAAPDETETIQFADESTDSDGSIASRQWSCSDGFSSTQTDPSHRFTDGGTYSCDLTVSDNETLTDTTTQSITVAQVPPEAGYTHSIVNPGEVQFTDASTHSNPADQPPTGWTFQWDFEDDGVFDSAQRNPFHDYGVSTGVFDVRLRVTDNDGEVDEIVKSIDVSLANEPPAANFTWQAPVAVNLAETFTDESTDPDSPIVRIEADFDGDGAFDDSVTGGDVGGSQLQHTYSSPGDYDVTWKVTDSRGATDEIVKVVHVCEPPFELTIGPGLRIHFEFCPAPIEI